MADELNRIEQSFQKQLDTLSAKIDKIRQDVTDSLTKLYMFERKRNVELQRKSEQIFLKYNELKDKLNSAQTNGPS